MTPLFRFLSLAAGFAGLVFLSYQIATTFPETDPVVVLGIAIPDLFCFFLAYKTYPAPAAKRVVIQRPKFAEAD
jgi:hypothetical protein